MVGKLYVVSTPIGNEHQITLEAINILQKVPIIAAENMGSNRPRIEKIIGKTQSLWMPYFDTNETTQSLKIIAHLKQGKDVALISSAGTPVICDPGYRLIINAYKYNIPVESIGGCSSVIGALSIAGLPPFPFTFFGFFHRKFFKEPLPSYTHIFFESSHRIQETVEFLQSLNQWKIILIKDLGKPYFARYVVGQDEWNPQGEWVILIGACD